MSLGGVQIARPWLVSTRIQNTGNQAIESRDIESPLRLTFQTSMVVSAVPRESFPDGIETLVEIEDSTVTFRHQLLNPGEWFSVDLLLDGEPARSRATARITGVSGNIDISLPKDATEPEALFIAVPKPVEWSCSVPRFVRQFGLGIF